MDDLVLIADSVENLIKIIIHVEYKGDKADLEINYNKSKILFNNHQFNKVKSLYKKTDVTNEVIYLGQFISFDNKSEKEI